MFRQFSMMLVFCCAIAVSFTSTASAITVPFTEHFSSDASNWYNAAGSAPVDWNSSGGPDGSGHVSSTFNFVGQTPGLPFPNNAVNLFRAQDEFNSSNHAFEGDWIGAGATQLSFWVRHNASTPMNFFARFSLPTNFPAWSAVEFTPVAPNVWTQITFSIQFGNPELFYEGPPPTQANFDQVFSNVGHLQIGAFGGTMAGVDQTVVFDLDQVSVIPAPGALAFFALAMFGASRKRRT